MPPDDDVRESDNDDEMFRAIGAERSDDTDDHSADDEMDLDLAIHGFPQREAVEPVPKTEQRVVDMGVRHVARSGDGLAVINTIEVLPPWELSV